MVPSGWALGLGSAPSPAMRQAPSASRAAGGDLQARDRGDAGQGLAAEAQGGDGLQVREAGDLAGGVAGQGQGQLVGGNAGAVVAHPQELDPALFQVDLDAVGPGVEAVLDQLLGHRGRALHHLAGGDLVDEVGGQGGIGGASGDGSKKGRGGATAALSPGSSPAHAVCPTLPAPLEWQAPRRPGLGQA